MPVKSFDAGKQLPVVPAADQNLPGRESHRDYCQHIRDMDIDKDPAFWVGTRTPGGGGGGGGRRVERVRVRARDQVEGRRRRSLGATDRRNQEPKESPRIDPKIRATGSNKLAP